MKNIIYTYQNYSEEEIEARKKIDVVMKMRKEEETRRFPYKKKGFMKRVK